MKLIDLDTLSIGLKNPEVFENKDYAKGWNDAIRCIMMEPVVEGCYCRECKHYDGRGVCKNVIGLTVANKDGFCCYGEKEK